MNINERLKLCLTRPYDLVIDYWIYLLVGVHYVEKFNHLNQNFKVTQSSSGQKPNLATLLVLHKYGF